MRSHIKKYLKMDWNILKKLTVEWTVTWLMELMKFFSKINDIKSMETWKIINGNYKIYIKISRKILYLKHINFNGGII